MRHFSGACDGRSLVTATAGPRRHLSEFINNGTQSRRETGWGGYLPHVFFFLPPFSPSGRAQQLWRIWDIRYRGGRAGISAGEQLFTNRVLCIPLSVLLMFLCFSLCCSAKLRPRVSPFSSNSPPIPPMAGGEVKERARGYLLLAGAKPRYSQ